jgi:pyrimidine operon attenuation protein/uracil phosphoribosyltransferase
MAETAELEVIANEADVQCIFEGLGMQIEQFIMDNDISPHDITLVAVKNGGLAVAERVGKYLDNTAYFRPKNAPLEVKTIDNSLYKDDDSFGPTKGGTDLTDNDVAG